MWWYRCSFSSLGGAELLPSPFEIMFGVEADDDRPIMTWCYPYPRVLTSVEITPVPLNPPQGCDPVVIEKIKVGLKICTVEPLLQGHHFYTRKVAF